MFIDSNLELCSATALNTGAAGAGYSIGSQIDMSVVRDAGNGRPIYLVIACTTTMTVTTAGTVQFWLASDSTATITPASCSIHLETRPFGVADMVAGNTIFCGPLPTNGQEPYEEFLGIVQYTATDAVTAGAIDAFLTLDAYAWKAYADAL